MWELERDQCPSGDLCQATGQFRDNIWAMIENWLQHLRSERSEINWKLISEFQLIDNVPALLVGISKVIKNPANIADFEPGGVIYQTASELGRNRWLNDFKASELLFEQGILRDVIWSFCRTKVVALGFFNLEQRINQALFKALSAIMSGYIDIYAMETRYITRRDKITDFLNYESFKETIEIEIKRSRRYRHSFSLMMIDIDRFKDYTDSLGNTAGAELIYKISRVIASVIRSVDVPARYGTDEFVIILPETNKKQARKVAERLRRAVKLETKHAARIRSNPKTAITISIGISSFPKDAKAADDLISVADNALFEAKRAGKDMVVWR